MRNRTDSTYNAQGKYLLLLIRRVITGKGLELAGLDHQWEALKSRRGVYTLKRAWNRGVCMATQELADACLKGGLYFWQEEQLEDEQ